MTNLAALADRYADIKAEIEGMELLLEEVKKEIKASGREEIIGTRSVVTLSLSESTRIVPKLVKEILTDAQVAACSKTSLVETIRVKTIKAPINA
jgi:type II secretory pathway predicted ATPase ExeA